jgi:hypothetical protein
MHLAQRANFLLLEQPLKEETAIAGDKPDHSVCVSSKDNNGARRVGAAWIGDKGR